MVFSSVLFLTMFLPIVLGIYFLAQEKIRNAVLLTASLIFYAWGEPKAVIVMVALIVLSYVVGLGIEKFPKYSKWILTFGILSNLSALIYYKYWMFLLENINLCYSPPPISVIPKIALPIGISFYVFQILSYLIDVYRGQVAAQRNLASLATYVSLFPQLVAGPIVRYETIEKDIQNRSVSYEQVYQGLRRFVIGLAKKVLIADQMAFVADTVFNSPVKEIPTLFAWVGALAYTLQIYYDFSGYSDMAIGLGRVFNFKFLENFNYPYISKSISEFWRRWHISLSTWFREYVYIPLGGNRRGNLHCYINLFIVFLITGFWHGATWSFIVWGVWNAIFIIIERVGRNLVHDIDARGSCEQREKGPTENKLQRILSILAPLRHLYALLVIITGWVIFRADTLTYAWQYIKTMFGGSNAPLNSFYRATEFLTYSNVMIFIISCVLSTPLIARWYSKYEGTKRDTCVMMILFVVAYVFAITSTFSPFIYFRF